MRRRTFLCLLPALPLAAEVLVQQPDPPRVPWALERTGGGLELRHADDSGTIRLPNGTPIRFRHTANAADIELLRLSASHTMVVLP